MKKALVFAGQGTHHKGMSMDLLTNDTVCEMWNRMKQRMMLFYGINLQEIIHENPSRIHAYADALSIQRLCTNVGYSPQVTKQSCPRTLTISHENGVMSYSYLTQPCVLAAQMIALQYLKCNGTLAKDLSDVCLVAGHSLGQLTALTALGVFKPQDAVELVYKRGLLMQDAFHNIPRGSVGMYVCNPQRARLHEVDKNVADDTFFVFVQLIAQKLSSTTSFLEIVNFNVHHQQYVVAGDNVALAVLGKCLDPHFRANCESNNVVQVVNTAFQSVKADKISGVTDKPNTPRETNFVSSSTRRFGSKNIFRRFIRGPDDGYTPGLQQLTHVTLQGDGQSGLKRKSWYLPLKLQIPYHTSRLRRCMDLFLPLIHASLPQEAKLRQLLGLPITDKQLWVSKPENGVNIGQSTFHNTKNQIHWVTNLTGSVFAPYNNSFIARVVQTISAPNIGEVSHKGSYSSNKVIQFFSRGLHNKCVGDICAAILAAQVAHPVYWTDVMDEIVIRHNCNQILQISPRSIVSNMFKYSVFKRVVDNGTLIIDVHTTCFPPRPSSNATT